MSKNIEEDKLKKFRDIQTRIGQGQLNVESLTKEKEKLQTQIAEKPKSDEEIKKKAEEYKNNFENIKANQESIKIYYEYWKKVLLCDVDNGDDKKVDVECVKKEMKEIDDPIEFLEKKVRVLQGEFIDPLFIWEAIQDESLKSVAQEKGCPDDKDCYLFNWDQLPTNDKEKDELITFLYNNYGIKWLDVNLEDEEIKVDKKDEKVIVFLPCEDNDDKYHQYLLLEKQQNKVDLKIIDDNFMSDDFIRSDEFIVKENSKIYKNDNKKLRHFLVQNFNVNWIEEEAQIKKIDNQITIQDGKGHYLSLKLKTIEYKLKKVKKVDLELNDGRKKEFKVNMHGNKHIVFYKSIEDVENEYKEIQKSKNINQEKYDRLKVLLKKFDDHYKKGQVFNKSTDDLYKLLNDKTKKEDKDKNKKIMCFYTLEMKEVKDKLKDLIIEPKKEDLIEEPEKNYKIQLICCLTELNKIKKEFDKKDLERIALTKELDAANKILNDLKKSRENDIKERLSEPCKKE